MLAELKMLGDFPYLDHYVELAKIERDLVHLDQRSKMIFVGGGPMPLTPICLCFIELAVKAGLIEELEACLAKPKSEDKKNALGELLSKLNPSNLAESFKIICVEKDPTAAQKSMDLVKFLSLDKAIMVQNIDGQGVKVPSEFNVFFIASMVIGKEEVVSNLMSQVPSGEEALFLIRSVEQENLRAILYEPIDNMLQELERKYPTLQRYNSYVPPSGSPLINSVHVYKYKNID